MTYREQLIQAVATDNQEALISMERDLQGDLASTKDELELLSNREERFRILGITQSQVPEVIATETRLAELQARLITINENLELCSEILDTF